MVLPWFNHDFFPPGPPLGILAPPYGEALKYGGDMGGYGGFFKCFLPPYSPIWGNMGDFSRGKRGKYNNKLLQYIIVVPRDQPTIAPLEPPWAHLNPISPDFARISKIPFFGLGLGAWAGFDQNQELGQFGKVTPPQRGRIPEMPIAACFGAHFFSGKIFASRCRNFPEIFQN